jgi:3'(2'), 5'-bisphosphate nucleotidase
MVVPGEAFPALLEAVAAVARAAGAVVMAVYDRDFSARAKDDGSPVTEADEAAESVIVAALPGLAPGVPIVAEEAWTRDGAPALGGEFWLVDPLDGTREFVARNGEFTVNIALVQCGRPVLGVVLAPALQRLYAGAQGVGAWVEERGVRRPIAARAAPAEGLTVVGSRSHGDAEAMARFLRGRAVREIRPAGSSVKLCLIASGEADVYPRFGRTMEWDIAAGQAVLEAAGGRVVEVDGNAPLRYGKPGFENPHFVAWGR